MSVLEFSVVVVFVSKFVVFVIIDFVVVLLFSGDSLRSCGFCREFCSCSLCGCILVILIFVIVVSVVVVTVVIVSVVLVFVTNSVVVVSVVVVLVIVIFVIMVFAVVVFSGYNLRSCSLCHSFCICRFHVCKISCRNLCNCNCNPCCWCC